MLQTMLTSCNADVKQGNILHGETAHRLNYLSYYNRVSDTDENKQRKKIISDSSS